MEEEFKTVARPEDKYAIDYINGISDQTYKVVEEFFDNISEDGSVDNLQVAA